MSHLEWILFKRLLGINNVTMLLMDFHSKNVIKINQLNYMSVSWERNLIMIKDDDFVMKT